MDRDIRTLDAITQEELNTLKTKSVCIIGAGGLGGYVIEMLTRLGIGTLRVADEDVFEESNLNRQLFSTEQNLGESKVKEARLRVHSVNSNVNCEIVDEPISKDNVLDVLAGADIVIDCVDNLETRYIMQDACESLNIPMIHGAVGAWQGQVSSIYPGDRTISKIYGEKYTNEIEPVGTASFLPAMVAAYQVSECVKVLLDKGEVLRKKIMYFDLLNNQSFVVDIKDDQESI